LFLRNDEPLPTRLGQWEWRWILGGLTESLYFDDLPENDVRPLSAFALALQPGTQQRFSAGVARSVLSPGGVADNVFGHAADVLTKWEPVRVSIDTTAVDSLHAAGTEQIFALFGRWVSPGDRFEVYAEWTRLELPSSLRDFLTSPNHSQGYTLGLQWLAPVGPDYIRLQTELTYLEESTSFKYRPVGTYYTSPVVPQGYTHRGQVLGAAIGPGSSSQGAALDYVSDAWQIGIHAQRIRWNTDALYTTPSPASGRPTRSFFAYDLSALGGLRGALDVGAFRLTADLLLENRLNYLFQNPDLDYTLPGVDIRNYHFRLSVGPRPPRL
jgi:hypothetical protein